jgi:hypothetical protein
VRGTVSAVRKAIEGNLAKGKGKGKGKGNEKLVEIWKQAREQLTVEEVGTDAKVRSSTARLKNKMANGKATLMLTGEGISRAVIGAVCRDSLDVRFSSLREL